ncbi:MAG: 30S ribosome-binding factor RbfA [Chloroflexi bacterium]|nr:30S ribosome-binding factor RbfA [Chloroflexota bacterium]
MNTIRQQRVTELLFEELSIMVANELDNPKLSLVQVTRVEISRDLRNARVFVNHQQEDVTPREVLKNLQKASPYLRSQLAERCALRMVPELHFSYDDIPVKAARVDELLLKIAAERTQTAQTTEAPSSEQAVDSQ